MKTDSEIKKDIENEVCKKLGITKETLKDILNITFKYFNELLISGEPKIFISFLGTFVTKSYARERKERRLQQKSN